MEFSAAVMQPLRHGRMLFLTVMLFWAIGLLGLIPVVGFFISLCGMAFIFGYWYQHFPVLGKKSAVLPPSFNAHSINPGFKGIIVRLVYFVPALIVAILFLWATLSKMALIGKTQWMAQAPDPLVIISLVIMFFVLLACDLFGNAAFLWYAKTRALASAWDANAVFRTASSKRFFISWLQAVGYYVFLLIVASLLGVFAMRDLGMWSAILFQTFLNALVLVFSTATLMLLTTSAFASTIKNR